MKIQAKYPIVDCKDVQDLYTDSLGKFAVVQYKESLIETNQHSLDALVCFCDKEVKTYGYSKTLSKTYEATLNSGETISGQVCGEYLYEKYLIKALKLSISFIIAGFNLVLRGIIINKVKWYGKKMLSQQMDATLKLLFVISFINTSWMLLFVNANFDNSSLKFLSVIFSGQYPDFTFDWYFKVGSLFTQTLLIVGLSPVAEATVFHCLRLLKKRKDCGYLFAPPPGTTLTTKATSVQQFVNIYSGPDMLFHFRYANITVTVFMAMIYGFGIPLLFPIALFNLCVQYTMDRILIVNIFQKPPLFDAQLNQTALGILQWAAFFWVGFGYWMLTNRQIFTNTVFPITY